MITQKAHKITDTVDGFHASLQPAANNLIPLDQFQRLKVPLLVDSDNNSFYTDPNGVSNLQTVVVDSLIWRDHISGFEIQDNYPTVSSNGEGWEYATLAPSEYHVCFLTFVEVGDADSWFEVPTCSVYREGATGILQHFPTQATIIPPAAKQPVLDGSGS